MKKIKWSEKYGHIIFFMKLKLINLILSWIETTASYVMYVHVWREKEKKLSTIIGRWHIEKVIWIVQLHSNRLNSFLFSKIQSFSCKTHVRGMWMRVNRSVCLYNQSGYTQNKENRVTHDTVTAFICGIGSW